MLLLIAFAFIAGIVTILSPCILPILPIILSGSVTGGKQKPLGIVTGFITSFTFFTLFLSTLVRVLGISADALRVFSIVLIFFFGLSLLIPQVQAFIERIFSSISSKLSPKQSKEGFFSGVVVGLSLGLLWTPCVGPILASVISLALTGSVTSTAFFITLAYSLGTALPMLLITYTGRTVFQKVPGLLANTKKIQQVFGVIMMATAIGLFFDIDRKFQIYFLQTFPQYGTGLTKFEDNNAVKNQLDKLQGIEPTDPKNMGMPTFQMLNELGNAPEIIPTGEWHNLPDGKSQLTLAELKGKVVLLDFWTYSCINCIRTMPYLRAWHEKYADDGLVILGAHAPEFEFEKSSKNVREAIEDFEIHYPVFQDNDFKTWKAYKNRAWPAKYLIDKNGKIRYTHIGEGDYDETEKAIQLLLKETGKTVEYEINNPTYDITSRTPELYLGYSRMEYLASPERVDANNKATYTKPSSLDRNSFSYDGMWNIGPEQSSPSKGAVLELNFEATEVFLVMRPKNEGQSGNVRVSLDELMVNENFAGKDVMASEVNIDSDRLYKLIKLDKAGNHFLKLEFLDDNVEIFAFTFG